MDNQGTQKIGYIYDSERPNVSKVLADVYNALVEKGYNPINQIVGYIMSGDPTYITSHKNARTLIMKVERDEILEELMSSYVENKLS
ncbi:MAG: IreB family regulatory phosphoprotein [Eubacteriales bacterium]|nr:IreB family regulatory phosphoprotein [Eubacteriales bacterium]